MKDPRGYLKLVPLYFKSVTRQCTSQISLGLADDVMGNCLTCVLFSSPFLCPGIVGVKQLWTGLDYSSFTIRFLSLSIFVDSACLLFFAIRRIVFIVILYFEFRRAE